MNKYGLFAEMLNKRSYLVLDGGMSNELENHGADLSTKLWTAITLLNSPEKVLAAHKAFVSGGADIITTCTYQASFPGFCRAGIPEEKQASVFEKGVELARQAAIESDRQVLVAASVGPYAAYLADGSEYSGYDHCKLTDEDFIAFHKPRLECLLAGQPDIIAIETIPIISEAVIISNLLQELSPNTPAWLTFSVSSNSHNTAGGDALKDAFEAANALPNVLAVGINCCSPKKPFLENIFKIIEQSTRKPIICYPNKGEKWDAANKQWIKNGDHYNGKRGKELYEAGVKVIGGCCRVGPELISDIKSCLEKLMKEK